MEQDFFAEKKQIPVWTGDCLCFEAQYNQMGENCLLDLQTS